MDENERLRRLGIKQLNLLNKLNGVDGTQIVQKRKLMKDQIEQQLLGVILETRSLRNATNHHHRYSVSRICPTGSIGR
jgi:hypothetical protein